jgi:dipeptidase E
VRLFLASDELGNPAGHGQLTRALAELAGPVARIAVVANGRDGEPPEQRRQRVAAEKASLEPLNAEVIELDLRDHVNGPDTGEALTTTDAALTDTDAALTDTDAALTDTDLIWITGGDMNLLRGLIRSSGLDSALRRRLGEDTIVYSGYSAGACLAGPALTVAELEGNPRAGNEVRWGGLGLVNATIVPHLPPAGAPDNDFVAIVKHLRGRGLRCHPLRDGQALVVSGDRADVI